MGSVRLRTKRPDLPCAIPPYKYAMPSLPVTARKYAPMSARQAHARLIDAIRSQLPIQEYIRTLNIAALSGQLPTYDPHTGRMRADAFEPLGVNQRLDLLRYLADKVMPALPPAQLAQDRDAPQASRAAMAERLAALTPEELSRMSGADLLALLASPVPSVPSTPSKPAPAHDASDPQPDAEDDFPIVIEMNAPAPDPA